MAEFTDITYEVDNGLAWITINRPERYNAFRAQTVDELVMAFKRAWASSDVGVIALTGAGDKAFCAGGDQKQRMETGDYGPSASGLFEVEALHRVIRDAPKPVIAAVNGLAIGGGHVLHVLCDLTIAADTAQFDPSKAQQETEAALTKLDDKVGGVLVANDGMAAGVVAALSAQHLAGKVLVTGQDATVAGLQRILTGEQSMTIYKSIPQEAQTAAKVAVGLLEGKPDAVSGVAKTTTDNGAGAVPSLLLAPQVITKPGVSVAVNDGATTWAALCQGIPASDCPQNS